MKSLLTLSLLGLSLNAFAGNSIEVARCTSEESTFVVLMDEAAVRSGKTNGNVLVVVEEGLMSASTATKKGNFVTTQSGDITINLSTGAVSYEGESLSTACSEASINW